MADAWTRVDEVLQSVLLRPPAERDTFLRQACAGDTALENEVRSLLAADEQAGLPELQAHAKAQRLGQLLYQLLLTLLLHIQEAFRKPGTRSNLEPRQQSAMLRHCAAAWLSD